MFLDKAVQKAFFGHWRGIRVQPVGKNGQPFAFGQGVGQGEGQVAFGILPDFVLLCRIVQASRCGGLRNNLSSAGKDD